MTDVVDWLALSPLEKKEQLFLNQKKTLDTFLEKNAISKAQYDKSLRDLREKMGMYEVQKSKDGACVVENDE